MRLRKLLRLPGPVALGWSKSDALGLRSITPFQSGKMWEDWDAHVSAKFPLRYFLAETVPSLAGRWIGRVSKAIYWLKSHVVPSRRYHMLDLRNVDPLNPYTHGYLDPSEVIRLASWTSLCRYVEQCEPRDPALDFSAEELDGPLNAQKVAYDTAMALYFYWKTSRIDRSRIGDKLHEEMNAAVDSGKDAWEAARDKWLSHCANAERTEQEMFMSLASIRGTLWT